MKNSVFKMKCWLLTWLMIKLTFSQESSIMLMNADFGGNYTSNYPSEVTAGIFNFYNPSQGNVFNSILIFSYMTKDINLATFTLAELSYRKSYVLKDIWRI